MKTRLFILMMLLQPLLTHASEMNYFKKLKGGDSINLLVTLPERFTQYPDVWDYEEVTRVELTGKVISNQDGLITISFKPIHFYSNFQTKDQATREKETGIGEYFYFDSYFSDQAGLEAGSNYSVGFGNKDSVNVVIDQRTGEVTTFCYAEKPYWAFQYQSIPKGIRKSEQQLTYINTWLTLQVDVASVMEKGVGAYFEYWADHVRKNKIMPWMVDLRKGNKPLDRGPVYVQLVSASFPLPPNVVISYRSDTPVEDKGLFLDDPEIKYTYHLSDDGVVECCFFLPAPQKLTFIDSPLWLTPGDTLSISKDKNGWVEYHGKGSAATIYLNELERNSRFFSEGYTYMYRVPSPSQFSEHLEEGKRFFDSLKEKYANEMSNYWRRSAELSYHYWSCAIRLQVYATTNKKAPELAERAFQIPWFGESMVALAPYTDYLYQPWTYDRFFDAYFDYKSMQLELEALTSFQGNFAIADVSGYYFRKVIFSGYPRFYLTENLLERLMEDLHLYKIQREYDDFLLNCREPGLRKKITPLYERLSYLEPGRNIKELKLHVEPLLPLKKEADGYILLEINAFKDDIQHMLTNLDTLKGSLNKAGLDGVVSVILARPEERKQQYETISALKPHIIYSTEKNLNEDTERYTGSVLHMLLIRNDGTIVSREIKNLMLGNPDASILDNLIRTIHEDQNRIKEPEAAESDLWFVIFFSSVISILVTFFIVRPISRRNERIKRYISELELKAIRAQMNPHFIFNALGSIQNLINRRKDQEANEYLVNFSKLLRMVLATSEKRIIPLSDEIEQLELYLKLEQLRFPFRYTIEVDPVIDPAFEEIPGMLIQPVVENAVIHGIQPKGEGEIVIRFILREQNLLIEVVDSGNGITEAVPGRKGFGLQAVRDRLKLLKKEMNVDIGLETGNLMKDGEIIGYKATIVIPL